MITSTTAHPTPGASEPSLTERFAPFSHRMRDEGIFPLVIDTFRQYYSQLEYGQTGFVSEASIRPVEILPDAEALPGSLAPIGRRAMERTVVIKLNGGLGTSMGLEKAKSLLQVREDLTFLDVIASQAQASGVRLLFMDSFSTQADTLAALKPHAHLWGDLPIDFVQNKVPKVLRSDLSPAVWPSDPSLEWCPPGHGDIYTALLTSGILDTLLAAGYRYAFVSNADNLGAVLDASLLGYFVQHRLPFMMEVADRTVADRKGGHLAKRVDGHLILRESAQCLPEDETAFQDISRHRYFNTNNLWLDLHILRNTMQARSNVLGLPMIRNAKLLDPRNRNSPAVYQIETAMGAAIGVFDGAVAIRVPRSRFAPVKTTGDLLAVRSDAYVLTTDYRIVPNPDRRLPAPPLIDLDAHFYTLIDDLVARFPYGPPSLIDCSSLVVRGDIRFGRNVHITGRVRLTHNSTQPLCIADGRVIAGDF